MKLHLGEGCAVKKAAIVGIFDMDTATVAPVTREFLKVCEGGGSLAVATKEIPASFVIEKEDNGKIKVYLTRNAPRALSRRAGRFGL